MKLSIPQLSPIAICITLTACGGGGSSDSSSPTAPVSAPPVTQVPDNTAQISVITIAKNLASNTECADTTDDTALRFTEIAKAANINYVHGNPNGDGIEDMSGGVGAGDFDGDGFVDLYAVGGEATPNVLLRNTGDGSFEQISHFAGVDLQNTGSGPAFADVNGDGLLDLFVGGVTGVTPSLFINQGNDSFVDVFAETGIEVDYNNFSASWGDIDKDNDLDLMLTHWTNTIYEHYAYLWRNNGDMTFTDISIEAGIPRTAQKDRTFTPSFADINNDGWQDILLVADNQQSRVFLNDQDGTFTDVTQQDVITDNAGMGSAIGDYDNDGDLDWFVSAISFKDGVTHFGSLTPGNRFYQNQGDGSFVDITDETGTRHGYWGWAACFSDFNNDMNLDIFHVNGMLQNGNPNIDEMFESDPSRLFIANGDGSFSEQSVVSGIEDNAMGRGIVCFDYDRDGDQDIFIANYNEAPKLFCNAGNSNNFLNVRLVETSANTQALGARIYVTTGDTTQMRELRSGNNYVSQNPVEAHFGLAQSDSVDEMRIVWPDGMESTLENVDANQFLVINRQ